MEIWKKICAGLLVSGVVVNSGTAEDSYDEWGQGTKSDVTNVEPISYNESAELALTDRLSELESRLDLLDGTVGDIKAKKSKKPKKDPTIVRSGTSKSTVKVSGRVQIDGWGFGEADAGAVAMEGGDPQNKLTFRRLRFGVKGNVKDNMKYKIEIDFAGGNSTKFKDAYFGWKDLPCLQTVLLGNQKRPYTLDTLNSSKYITFIERSMMSDLNNPDARRLGLATYGVSEDERCSWRFGVFNQQDISASGTYARDHLQMQVAGRLASTFWYDEISGGRGYAHFGISGNFADSDGTTSSQTRFRARPEARTSNRWVDTGVIHNTDYYAMLGFENVINVGSFQVGGEFQLVDVSRFAGSEDVSFHGGYIYASYFLTGEHIPWSRKKGTVARVKPFQNFWAVERCDGCVERGWGAWQVAARAGFVDYNDGTFVLGDPTGGIRGGEATSLTLALNWYLNPNTRMMLNYVTGKIDNRSISGAAPIDGDYHLFGGRFAVDF